ncbi:tautomerase family protein [Desulforudis sp. 1031]|uniref:tautomerase family protein n=1 Tax=unclassified Candidatus Desulforudis TaxID=2635950 RepID=UPI003CEBBB4B
MQQVKIYGLKSNLAKNREALSDAIRDALKEAFGLPPEKRFQRFIGLEREEFVFPQDRSENYIILEFSVFEGRSVEAEKKLIVRLFELVSAGWALRRKI